MDKPILLEETSDEEFERLSFRERFRLCFDEVCGTNMTMPVFVVVAMYAVLGILWWAVFWFAVVDHSEDVFSVLNVRKFVLYNVLHGVLGFGATSGPLGAKSKTLLGASGLTFLTPGTLCSPLFPALVGCLQRTPGKRSMLAVVFFAAYILALFRAMVDPCTSRIILAIVTFALASVFDTVVFFASRGEHYGYHMFCMMFPDWVGGCQCVQLMLWINVGLSKCGPWFKYVIQILMTDAVWTPCLPKHFNARLFLRDWPHNYDPSNFSHFLGHMGALGEWVLPLCCLATPGTVANCVGVTGMIGYHAFIWLTLPFASVFEWQYYSQFMTYFLYARNGFSLPTSPVLVVFLVLVLVVIPVVGQIWPRLVPFLMAYRQYSGNWRAGVFMVRKSARPKFEKIKAWNPVCNLPVRTEFVLGAPVMSVPQYRGMFSIFERFFDDSGCKPSDFFIMNSFTFSNAVFGWDLQVGWLWFRECFRTAVVDICSLEAGECYVLQIEPVSILPPYLLTYRLMDLTKGPMDAEVFADVPYSDLEGTHPMDVYLKPELIQRGKSIRGTFLSTYY